MFSDVEIAIFQEELEEKLQVINDNILLLEQQKITPEVIQEIFRAAHTIKGSSAIMGYDKMTELTHEIESLFDAIRQNRLEITTPLVDLLFESMDVLTVLKEEIIGGAAKDIDITPLLKKMKQFQTPLSELEVDSAQEPQEVQEPAPALLDVEMDQVLEQVVGEAELRGYRAYALQIQFEQELEMKEVRAYLLFETLEQVGEIIKSNPPAEDIQNGLFDQSIALVLISQMDRDQIKNLALSVAEIKEVYVRPMELSQENQVGDGALTDQSAAPGQAGGETAKQKAATGDTAASVKLATDIDSSARKVIKTVRVDVERLDKLMNLVGELVIDRTRLERFAEIFETNYGADELAEDIQEISSHLGQVTTDLQHEIMKARMLPVGQVFNRFPRMVRDIAHKLGKEVDFIVEGRETELDRNVIEVIGDPLIHLLRNSIDHGLESPAERQRLGKPAKGLLRLSASYVESHIMITVEDDGQGIDAQKLKDKALAAGIIEREQYERMGEREALNLIFMPGFSTIGEDQVSDVSGRGVGMDIVRTQIENINGTVEYTTTPGRGTTFFIKLPLTLAIIKALMVEHSGRVYAFPLAYVVETLNVKSSEIKDIRHSEVIVVRGQVYPLRRLGDIYFHNSTNNTDHLYVVIVGSGESKIGIVVDRLVGEQEIVIKSLGAYLGQVEGLAGATILGDGKVALIVDVRGLLRGVGSEEAASYAMVH